MNIQLPTGKTMSVSAYEYFFVLKESEVDEFFRQAIADDEGAFIENPFSQKGKIGRIQVEELPDIPELDEQDEIVD